MKKFLWFTVISLFCTSPAFALLSPLNQSFAEIKAVVENREIAPALPQGESIQMIYRVQNGYLLMTQTTQLFVEVKKVTNGGPGPQKFNLVVHKPLKFAEQP